MRLLRRNTTKFLYQANTGVESDLNSDGEHTGEYHTVYSDPTEYRGNISTPSGQTNWEFYGLEGRYTHTLLMDKPAVDIHEGGIIQWKGGTYDILAVRPSLNFTSIALRKQTENHAAEVAEDPHYAPVTTVNDPPTGGTGGTGGEAP